ncbi:MAG: RteC domain-containing protein [Cyclobacteriaceae bacterium]|jgi:hypothetical protein|nr:RteC domain-containing protein [Cyclobacteriaceae bacterium]
MKQNEQNYEQRLADLNKKLGVIQRDQTNKLLQAVASYELVKEVIGSLPIGREMQNSIQFNKIVFPQFLSLLIYYRYMVSIFSSEPLRKSDQIAHLKAFRKKLEWFCLEHRELIQYCRSGATDRDDYYFTNKPNQLLPEETPAYVWSKYLASHRLNDLINFEIMLRKKDHEPSEIVWTAQKTSLIELLYALHAANVFNDGKAGLKHVAEAFERIFQVNLGNYYRVFQDIRQRKINQTVFLDQLKEKFLQRVHELE